MTYAKKYDGEPYTLISLGNMFFVFFSEVQSSNKSACVALFNRLFHNFAVSPLPVPRPRFYYRHARQAWPSVRRVSITYPFPMDEDYARARMQGMPFSLEVG